MQMKREMKASEPGYISLKKKRKVNVNVGLTSLIVLIPFYLGKGICPTFHPWFPTTTVLLKTFSENLGGCVESGLAAGVS